MIELKSESFSGIECLHAFPAGQRDAPLPSVIFYHGFTSSKEVYAYFAVALAQAGFRAVLPDADLHGARYSGDSELRLTRFWEILRSNIDELPGIEQALRARQLVDAERLAVAGASMGGMTALGAMARYPQLRAAASMMGSGYFSQLARTLFPPRVARTQEEKKQLAERLAPLAQYDVGHQLEKLANRPLLLWHGDADDVVPPDGTFRLQQALKNEGLDGNLTCLWEAGVRHRITPTALDATVSFFRQHL